jgi:hypothetical protein
MLKDDQDRDQKIQAIKAQLTRGYSDHGFCITCEEAKQLGLRTEELHGELLDVVWKMFRLERQRQELEARKKQQEMEERIRKLPPEILKQIPDLDELLQLNPVSTSAFPLSEDRDHEP